MTTCDINFLCKPHMLICNSCKQSIEAPEDVPLDYYIAFLEFFRTYHEKCKNNDPDLMSRNEAHEIFSTANRNRDAALKKYNDLKVTVRDILADTIPRCDHRSYKWEDWEFAYWQMRNKLVAIDG
jgi:hypothetical protein